MSDEPKTTLTDGSPVTPDHREIDALVLAQRAACDAMIDIHNIGISSADCTMRMRAEAMQVAAMVIRFLETTP